MFKRLIRWRMARLRIRRAVLEASIADRLPAHTYDQRVELARVNQALIELGERAPAIRQGCDTVHTFKTTVVPVTKLVPVK